MARRALAFSAPLPAGARRVGRAGLGLVLGGGGGGARGCATASSATSEGTGPRSARSPQRTRAAAHGADADPAAGTAKAERDAVPAPPPAMPLAEPTPEGFALLEERQIFSRYQSVSERLVQYPNEKRVSFDVLGLGSFQSVFVFPIDVHTGTTTLIREYSPGQHRVMRGFPAGLWDPQKHLTMEDAARAELSEEAQLVAGRLERLTGSHGIAADKYSRNVFHYFLGLDCVLDVNPGKQDHEEWIEVVPNVELSEVRGIVARGEMNTPNCLLANLALDRLQDMGIKTR